MGHLTNPVIAAVGFSKSKPHSKSIRLSLSLVVLAHHLSKHAPGVPPTPCHDVIRPFIFTTLTSSLGMGGYGVGTDPKIGGDGPRTS